LDSIGAEPLGSDRQNVDRQSSNLDRNDAIPNTLAISKHPPLIEVWSAWHNVGQAGGFYHPARLAAYATSHRLANPTVNYSERPKNLTLSFVEA
jgi:hypothetical protein